MTAVDRPQSDGSTQSAACPEPRFDYDPFVSPDLEDPHITLKEARSGCPVFFSPALQTWVLTRYADIVDTLADTPRFSSLSATTNDPTPPPPPVLEVLAAGIPFEGGMVDMDPPKHTLYRRLFNRAFTPRRLAIIEPRIKEIAAELVTAFAGKGSGDLVREIAYPLPMRVIAGVLGVPESDMGAFKRWSDDWLLLISQRGTMEELVTAAKGVTDFQRYIHGFIEQQRLNPCDDLMGDLVRAVAEMDEPPTTNALVGVIMTILFAGHETTTTLIGNTVRLLLQHPDQLEAVSADPTLLPSAVTEVLRYDPPVPGMYRTTTKDVEIGGVWLPAGSHLQLAYASANRDEDVFDEPDRFDIHRAKDQPILSFGRGIHFCLGANLAQTEVREVVAQLLESLPGLRFMPGHEMRPVQSATVRGNAEIWLEWDVADAGAPSS